MKNSREFEIAFVGIKPGLHQFNYSIEDSFFEKFENPGFTQSNIDVKLSLDKKSNAFILLFEINGKVTLPCDRCGDDFELNLWDEFDLMVKIIEDADVSKKSTEDAEVAYIGRSESVLDVSAWIYEFIVLSVPMQHIHPEDENGNSGCNPKALDILNQQKTEDIPSIWKDLKNKIN